MIEWNNPLTEWNNPLRSAGKDPIVAGIVLIVVGLGLYVLQNTRLDESVLFLGIGGAFMAAYFYRRVYGFLVPAGILLGMGVGQILDTSQTALAEPELFGLGLGFLSIYAIDRLHTRTSGGFWPLFPAVPLLLIGSADNTQFLRWFFRRGWPLVIALVGVILLLRGLAGRRSGTYGA